MHADIPPGSEHACQRAVIGSDAYYGMVLAGTIAVAVAYSGGDGRVPAVAALAAMAPWYIVVGRAATRSSPVPARTLYYVLGLIVLLGIAQAADAWSSLVLFALCPQCFVLLPVWRAAAAVAAFNLVPVLQLAGDPGAALGAAGIAVGVVVFAAAFGRWIIRIIEQSRERRNWSRPSRLPGPNSPAPSMRPAPSPNGSGWPRRFTTRSRRGSPASSCCCTPLMPRPRRSRYHTGCREHHLVDGRAVPSLISAGGLRRPTALPG